MMFELENEIELEMSLKPEQERFTIFYLRI